MTIVLIDRNITSHSNLNSISTTLYLIKMKHNLSVCLKDFGFNEAKIIYTTNIKDARVIFRNI